MNYLAHLLLSGDDPGLRAGGFLGDFVKGRLRGRLPAPVERGIALHRFLDARTDRDPGVRASLARFPASLRRFAPIVLDVYWDHLLARDFERLAGRPLAAFAAGVYADLARHRACMSAEADRFRRRMAAADLLCAYREPATVEGVLARIGRRLSRPNPLPECGATLRALGPSLAADFAAAFPRLDAEARHWRATARCARTSPVRA